MRGETGDAGIAAAFGIGVEAETEFAARIAQGVKIADLGMDRGEVGHGCFEVVGCWLEVIGRETQRAALPKWRSRPLRVGGSALVMGVVGLAW
jgi:hypothetical protein